MARITLLAATEVHRGIAYGPEAAQRLDVMVPRRPKTKPPFPGAVVFHGGSWVRGSRDEVEQRVCRRFAEEGFVVANVDYRWGVEAATEDGGRALAWFFEHAGSYGVDRERVVVAGESAGGHIGMMAAFRSPQRVAAVVSFSGVTDLAALFDRDFVREGLGPGVTLNKAIRLSPVSVAGAQTPLLTVHGSADPLVPESQSTAMRERVLAVGGEAEGIRIPGGGHGFTEAELEPAWRGVFDFLRRRKILNN